MDEHLSKHDHPPPNLQLWWCFGMFKRIVSHLYLTIAPVRSGIRHTLGKRLHLRQVAELTYALFAENCTTGGGLERVFILPVLGR